VLGAFPNMRRTNAKARVMRNHRLAAYDADEYEGLQIKPQGIKANIAYYLLTAATKAWDDAVQLGENLAIASTATVIAPTDNRIW